MFEVDDAMDEHREAGRPAHLVLKKIGQALEEFETNIDNNASTTGSGYRRDCGIDDLQARPRTGTGPRLDKPPMIGRPEIAAPAPVL
jgi:hypothetical protein